MRVNSNQTDVRWGGQKVILLKKVRFLKRPLLRTFIHIQPNVRILRHSNTGHVFDDEMKVFFYVKMTYLWSYWFWFRSSHQFESSVLGGACLPPFQSSSSHRLLTTYIVCPSDWAVSSTQVTSAWFCTTRAQFLELIYVSISCLSFITVAASRNLFASLCLGLKFGDGRATWRRQRNARNATRTAWRDDLHCLIDTSLWGRDLSGW